MIRSFPPIINSETEILIVGTMPSVKSLEAQQYYAHPRNAFWKIIAALYHQGAEFADFQEKKACLLANRLGLWDSLQLCLREGSLDSAITDEQPNDFPAGGTSGGQAAAVQRAAGLQIFQKISCPSPAADRVLYSAFNQSGQCLLFAG